jgi:mannosyltransferase OCH1-like enzyme
VIPKLFHRVWLDDSLPETFSGWGERLRGLHPGWEVREWRDSSLVPWQCFKNRDLIKRAGEICPRDAKRFAADLIRLELLWIYGGVYVDCDVEPLKAFDPLLDSEAFIAYSPNRGPKGERLLTQAVMAARPHHPFIGACLQAVPESVERYAGRPLAQMVGPWMVHRVWESQTWPDVLTLPEQMFHPQSIRDRDRGRPADLDGAYAWHHYNSSARRRGKGAT